jgi:hypothetical protein
VSLAGVPFDPAAIFCRFLFSAGLVPALAACSRYRLATAVDAFHPDIPVDFYKLNRRVKKSMLLLNGRWTEIALRRRLA